MKPTVGRIVHWVPPAIVRATCGAHYPEHVAAVVVDVRDGERACLHVMLPADRALPRAEHTLDVPHDEAGAPGTWHWPEREAST